MMIDSAYRQLLTTNGKDSTMGASLWRDMIVSFLWEIPIIWCTSYLIVGYAKIILLWLSHWQDSQLYIILRTPTWLRRRVLLSKRWHAGASTCVASSTVDVRQGAEPWWQRSLGHERISIQQASSSAILCNLLIHAGEPLWKPQGLWQLACKPSFPILLLYLVSLSEVLSACFG